MNGDDGNNSLRRRPSDSGLGDGARGGADALPAVRRDAGMVNEASAVQGPGPCFDGAVSVVNSTCQFGGNTFYHGPVTVVLPDTCADAGVVVAAKTAPPDDEAQDALPGNAGCTLTSWRALRAWQRFALLIGGPLLAATVCLSLGFAFLRPVGVESVATESAPSDGSTSSPIQVGDIVSRRGWGAEPARTATKLITPVGLVIVHHTDTAECTEDMLCQDRVKYIQRVHMIDMGWDDIGYNFLVGGDGLCYEGRGWDVQGAHTAGWNSLSVGVALIGNFCSERLPARQLEALRRLLRLGEGQGMLRSDYALLGRCQINANLSPGLGAMVEIQTLPHWSNSSTATCRSCGPTVQRGEIATNGTSAAN